MKSEILLRPFGIPFLVAILLFTGFSSKAEPFHTYMGVVFLISIVLSRVLTDKCYVSSVSVSSEQLTVFYITQFLQGRTRSVETSQITGIKLSRSEPGIWPAMLYLKTEEGQLEFRILHKKEYRKIREQLTSLSPSLANVEVRS
jgi:hypothetical protein